MNSAPVFSRGSTQVLGNMPFSSEFATGSALHETDIRLDAVSAFVTEVNFQLKEVESTRPTRDEIHKISGHYANHEEVREWAKYASANAKVYTDDEIEDLEERVNGKIISLSGELLRNDTVVLGSANNYSHDIVFAASSFLLERFDNAISDEIIDRTAAVSGENKRAKDEEYRIETKFDGLCATLSSDLSAVSAISKAEDERIDRRIDRYEQVFSAVLDDVSAVAYHADQENKFVNFLNDAGIVYSSGAHTMYLGRGKSAPVDFSVSGDLKTSGDLTTKNIAANSISSNDIHTKSVVTDSIDTISFVAGSGNNVIAYNGGDTVEFGNATVSVNPGSVVYKFDPAVSYEGKRVKVGVPTASDTVSSISIGGANADKNDSIVIATPGTSTPGAVANKEGSITFYTPSNENGVFIGTSSVPEIITKYAPSRTELEEEVQDEIKNASGIIRSGIQEEVETAVSARIRSTELNLSAYVNEETQKRIDDVQSVRDELPFYLHTSGGTIWGDLTVNNVNLFDEFFDWHEGIPGVVVTREPVPVEFEFYTSYGQWPTFPNSPFLLDSSIYGWRSVGFTIDKHTSFFTGEYARNVMGVDPTLSAYASKNGRMLFNPDETPAVFLINIQKDIPESITNPDDLYPSSYNETRVSINDRNGTYSGPYRTIVVGPPSASTLDEMSFTPVEVRDQFDLEPKFMDGGSEAYTFGLSGSEFADFQHEVSLSGVSAILYTPTDVLSKMIENDCPPSRLKIKLEANAVYRKKNLTDTSQEVTAVPVNELRVIYLDYSNGSYVYTQDDESVSVGWYNETPYVEGHIKFHDSPMPLIPSFQCLKTGNVTLAEYIDDQTELTKCMLEVTTSARRTAASAYSIAVDAYNTATEAHDLIVQAQGVVASASNTATSAYNIAMSAYALSGVLREVADYLREINGEG